MPELTRLLLKYPNGRTHEECIPTREVLSLGLDFDRYGHHWRVVGQLAAPKRFSDPRPGYLCEIDPPPAAPGG